MTAPFEKYRGFTRLRLRASHFASKATGDKSPGFTLVELLLVIGIIAILAVVVFNALNPKKQLNAARDSDRQSSVITLQSAIGQYFIDKASLPGVIPTELASAKPICKQGITSDPLCVNLDVLVPTYIVQLPQDPIEPCPDYSGYKVYNHGGKIQVVSTNVKRDLGDITTASCGLLAEYKFDDDMHGALSDNSGNGNAGTITGVTADPSAPAGLQFADPGSGAFDGSSASVDLGNPSALNMTGSVTIAAWVYMAGGVGGVDTGIVTKGTAGSLAYGLTRDDVGSKVWGYLNGSPNNLSFVTNASDTWTHIAMTYDKDALAPQWKLYVNGTVVASRNFSQQISQTSSPLLLGKNGSSFFRGKMDDVRIYGRALSAVEVGALAGGKY